MIHSTCVKKIARNLRILRPISSILFPSHSTCPGLFFDTPFFFVGTGFVVPKFRGRKKLAARGSSRSEGLRNIFTHACNGLMLNNVVWYIRVQKFSVFLVYNMLW